MKWFNRCSIVCVIAIMLFGLTACFDDDDDDGLTSPATNVDVTGDWAFEGTISHNNCVGFFFLPVGTPRDVQLRLEQNGTQVTGSRTGGTFWSLVEGVLVAGENDGKSVSLEITNPIMQPPPEFTWAPGMTETDCLLLLSGTATMNFTSETSATGDVAAPVTYVSGDCGVWIQPLPCDMTVSGEWTKIN